MKKQMSQAGFTLIELMVTVAVAIIVLAIGIPMYDSMLANNRAVSQSNMFVTAMNLAKSEAISQNLPVAVCANASATNTTEATLTCSSSGGTDWANGWFVFQDIDRDGVKDGGETVLRLWQAMEVGTNVVTNVDLIRYTSLGEKDGTATISFRLAQVDDSGNLTTTGTQSRCIYINAIGQIRVERVTGSKGTAASTVTCP